MQLFSTGYILFLSILVASITIITYQNPSTYSIISHPYPYSHTNCSPSATASKTVILEASLSSNNNCNPCYAVDEDIITLTFTTAKPSNLPPKIPYPNPNESSSRPLLILNPTQDYRHFICVFSVQNGSICDQNTVTIRQLLSYLFDGNFIYYGTDSQITYYAPITYTYQIEQLSQDRFLLDIQSNHPVQLIAPTRFATDSGSYFSVSVIDVAGNGPCCLTIPLEDSQVLLYNLGSTGNSCIGSPLISKE